MFSVLHGVCTPYCAVAHGALKIIIIIIIIIYKVSLLVIVYP